MKTLTCAAAAVAAALLAASPGTAGKGGPTPDPLGGWDGVVSASGAVRYVALPGRGTTTVAGVRVSDGRVLRYATVPGLLGIPQVTWDGKTDGISANGQRLVLASITSRPLGLQTTFVVLRANTLGVQRRIELSGHWVFDAISPTGRRSTPSSTPTSRTTAFAPSTRSAAACSQRRSSTSASPTRRCAARR